MVEDDYVDLSQAPMVDTAPFGKKAWVAAYNNEFAQQVFDDTADRFPADPYASVYRLLNIVRWGMLQIPLTEYAGQVGVTPLAAGNTEKAWDCSRTQSRATMEHVLAFWKQRDIAVPIREQLLTLLWQTHGDNPAALYRMMCYDVGTKTFTKRTGIKTSMIEARERGEQYPDYLEVLNAIRVTYGSRSTLRGKRIKQGREIWRNGRMQELQKQTVEEPLARFMTELEIHLGDLDGSAFIGTVLYRKFGPKKNKKNPVSNDHAGALVRGELVPWNIVEPIACQLFRKQECEELGAAWKQIWEVEQRRTTFEGETKRIRDEQNIRTVDLLDALRIKAPMKDRSRRLKALFERGFSGQVAANVVIGLLARSQDEERYLTELYRGERQRRFCRKGVDVPAERLALRIDRDLYGVRPNNLAKILHDAGMYDDFSQSKLAQRIVNIEVNALKDDSLQEDEIHNIRVAMETHGREKLAETRTRFRHGCKLPDAYTQFSTIHDAARLIPEGAGGPLKVVADIQKSTDAKSLRISGTRLREMKQGKNYPPLPTIAHMLGLYGLQVTEVLRHDWHAVWPVQFVRKYPDLESCYLTRVLYTIIAACEPSERFFLRNRMPECSPHTSEISNYIRWVYSDQEKPWWDGIERILLAAHFGPDDIQWKLVEALYDNDDDLAEAFRELHPHIRRNKIALNHVNFPGFTCRELSQYRDAVSNA